MNKTTEQYDVIIIGAGASGLMCAITAGYKGLSVLILDHGRRAMAKIKISGGGNCNFTNTNVFVDDFICQNIHFVKSALSSYKPSDFIDLVERHGLNYIERDHGKLFCKDGASELIKILRLEADWAGVKICIRTEISKVSYIDNKYFIETDNQKFQTNSLVIATGALSFPKLNATDFGYKIAKQFQHQIIPPRPGLVPLKITGKWLKFCQSLSGIAIDVSIKIQQQTFNEPLLFTHQGISGPSVLQASNYWNKGDPLNINFLPNIDVLEALKNCRENKIEVKTWLKKFWPKKLIQAWLQIYPLDDINNVSNEELQNYALIFSEVSFYPSDTAGYDKAEVTLGGIDTKDISSKTMESKKQKNLYFIGEVLDVTGHLGGYNFQWAWSSGFACGINLDKND